MGQTYLQPLACRHLKDGGTRRHVYAVLPVQRCGAARVQLHHVAVRQGHAPAFTGAGHIARRQMPQRHIAVRDTGAEQHGPARQDELAQPAALRELRPDQRTPQRVAVGKQSGPQAMQRAVQCRVQPLPGRAVARAFRQPPIESLAVGIAGLAAGQTDLPFDGRLAAAHVQGRHTPNTSQQRRRAWTMYLRTMVGETFSRAAISTCVMPSSWL